ncbi:MAG: thrombospondin type 3 repeat-containing protein, partial [Deltaproteobacteria bacterium]|nr:thrombospondin type 3 repeat-containing protein [Deltaproteobacteria bacterium]
VFSASSADDSIAWYRNKGGHFALPTMSSAPLLIMEGTQDDALKITATHRGRAGDNDVELVTFDLLFEEMAGDALTSAEANNLIENLHIYLDDGSTVFESGSDTLVATVVSLSLAAGVQTASFTDNDVNVQVMQGTPRTYFVVAELTANAGSQVPTTFRVSHLTETTSTGEDRDNDLPLVLEFATNVASSLILASCPTCDFDMDGLLDTVENNTGNFAGPSQTGTSPFDPDSDNDGLLDGVETNTNTFVDANDTGTDPNDADSDNDGLLDGVETGTGVFVNANDTGTNPNDADSDNDGFNDGDEVLAGTDPNDPFDPGGTGVPALNPVGVGLFLTLLAAGAALRRRRSAR